MHCSKQDKFTAVNMLSITLFLLGNILLFTSVKSAAYNEECGGLRRDFELLKEEFSNMRQYTRELSDRIADLENKLETERGKRYLVDGEIDIEKEVTKLIGDVSGIKQGYTGGKWYADTGGPANYVCMPEDPQWAKYLDGFQDIGNRMYGTEYEDNHESTFNPFNVHRDDEDAPCVACRSQRATTVMIPARTSCYTGWHLEYTGYLMTMGRQYHSSSEYICVDKDPEVINHGSQSDDGNLLYIVEAACGSLPCAPYVNGRELTCAVCSK